jgi:dTDP-4-amino-4,6-dideoxygalactose transaminase
MMHYNAPTHLQPAANCMHRGQFPVTEHLCGSILAFPANQSLSRNDIEFISTEIRELLGTQL